MRFFVRKTPHQFQLRPVSLKKSRKVLFPLGVETNQGMQMPAVYAAW
jgi:hypothetical protein